MTAIPDSIPLRNHRASLQEYLRSIVFAGDSVAGRIIEERLPPPVAADQIRPSLVLWACAASGGDLSDALPVGAAFDLFDRFLLLHDELANDSGDTVARWGLGQSLNAGDALYALAFRSLASDVGNAPRRLEAARFVADAVLRAIDSSGAFARSAALTAAALQAGALIGGASPDAVQAFATAGRLMAAEPDAACAALRAYASHEHLEVFEEVARYVARRAA